MARTFSVLLAFLIVPVIFGAGCRSAPTPGELEYRRGLNALAESQFVWARKHFAAAFQEDPERWQEALRLAGVAWLSGPSQSLASAVDSFRRYLEYRPDHPEVRQRLAGCLKQMGEVDEALVWLEGLETDAGVAMLEAEILLESDPAAALRIVEAIPTNDPQRSRALALASDALGRLGRDDEALARALESVALNPVQERTWYRASRLHMRRGEIAEATRAVEISQLFAELDQFEDSRPITERLRWFRRLEEELDRSNPHLAELRVQLLLAGGDPEEVRVAMHELSAVAEPDIELRLDYAGWLLRQGEAATAEGLLREVLAEEPRQRRARDSLVRLLIGRGELVLARQLVEESLEDESHLARHQVRLGQIAIAEGNGEEAMRRFETALHLAPWQAEWRLEMVQLLLDAGKRAEAEAVLEGAPEIHPALEGFRRQQGFAPGA